MPFSTAFASTSTFAQLLMVLKFRAWGFTPQVPQSDSVLCGFIFDLALRSNPHHGSKPEDPLDSSKFRRRINMEGSPKGLPRGSIVVPFCGTPQKGTTMEPLGLWVGRSWGLGFQVCSRPSFRVRDSGIWGFLGFFRSLNTPVPSGEKAMEGAEGPHQ